MKATLSLIIIISFFLSCTPSRYYKYDVELNHPIKNQKLEYTNDTLDIDFVLEPKWISFT